MIRFLALLLLLFLPCPALAETPALLPCDTAEAQAYLSRLAIAPWTDDGSARLIDSFHVDASGRTALSFFHSGGYGRTYAGVFDREGAFLWGFSYNAKSASPVLWDGSGRLLLLGLNYAVTIGEGGVCEGISVYADEKDANRARLAAQNAQAYLLGEERFLLRRTTPLSLGYSTLVRVAPDGTEVVLYDRPGPGIASGLLLGGVAALVAVGMLAARKKASSK